MGEDRLLVDVHLEGLRSLADLDLAAGHLRRRRNGRLAGRVERHGVGVEDLVLLGWREIAQDDFDRHAERSVELLADLDGHLLDQSLEPGLVEKVCGKATRGGNSSEARRRRVVNGEVVNDGLLLVRGELVPMVEDPAGRATSRPDHVGVTLRRLDPGQRPERDAEGGERRLERDGAVRADAGDRSTPGRRGFAGGLPGRRSR